MLDKNMDWKSLQGKDDWKPFYIMAAECMKIHHKRGLPCYKWGDPGLPPQDLFAIPNSMEGALGYMDTQQLMKVGNYDNDTPQARWVCEHHGLDYAFVKMHTQPCGMVVKNHFDVNGSPLKSNPVPFGTMEVVKVLHFLSDWQLGQVIMLGHEAVTNWKSGDSLTFPWYMEHATANANSVEERHMLFISGVKRGTHSSS